MKIIIPLIVLSSFFSSCSTLYVQVYETDSKNVTFRSEKYSYEDENVYVTYDLWAERGILNFTIYNKTNNPIYIDWKNSNFVRLDYSFNYWQDVEKITGKSKTYSAATVSGSSGFGYSTSVGHFINKRERPSEQLPPKSYIRVDKFFLSNQKVYDPKLKVKGDIISQDFNKNNTPLYFRNYLAYSFDKDFNDLTFIDNDFWVSRKQVMKRKTFDRELSGNINTNNKFYDQYSKTNAVSVIVVVSVIAATGAILIITSL